MDYKLFINRKIIDVLIGDTQVFGTYSLPYLSGPNLCSLCTTFGLPRKYIWGGGNKSRWEYMQELLNFLNPLCRVPDLLSYLFQQGRFENLTAIGDVKMVSETYNAIVKGALDVINAQLVIAKLELRIVNKRFTLVAIGEEISFETPNVKVVSSQYIRELPDRIKDDIDNEDYDSVITKSRTLLEEVLIFIIEKKTFERYKGKGDLVNIYQYATSTVIETGDVLA